MSKLSVVVIFLLFCVQLAGADNFPVVDNNRLSGSNRFYGWRFGSEKVLIYELEFKKVEAFPYFQAERIEIRFDASVDLSVLRLNLVSYSGPDTTLDLTDIADSDETDDRIIYTGNPIPVYSKTHRETGKPGLGFKYQLYNRPNAQHIDIAITVDGFLPDFNHFTLTRQIEDELWSKDIPNVWVITEVKPVPSAPSLRQTQTLTWARLKTQ